MKKQRLYCILGLLLPALFAGCSAPGVIETYEYHHRYDRMSDAYDPPVSLVYMEPDTDLSAYKDIAVGEFRTGRHRVEDQEQADRYASVFFRQVLAGRLLDTGHFYVTLDPDYQSSSPTAVIEGKITVFDTGSGAVRFLSSVLFFLQRAAAVDLQIEGRLRDARTGSTLLEFADRRRFLGHTPWGSTLKTLDDDWAMKQTCILTAESLASLLAHLHRRAENGQGRLLNEQSE